MENKRRVMIVDDNELIVDLLVDILRDHNFDIIAIANSVDSAIIEFEKARENVDIIITDMHMFGQKGTAFAKYVRESMPTKNIKIIAFFSPKGCGGWDDVKHFFDGKLEKPAFMSEIVKMLD